jgi:hypothetical protein
VAAGTYARAYSSYSGTFGFSGNSCQSQGETTLNICTANGFYHNGEEVGTGRLDESNEISSSDSVVGGGYNNAVYGSYSTISGGTQNVVQADYGSVGGGLRAKVFSNYAVAMGGYNNRATGRFAVTLGGSNNYARGRYSMALGKGADAKGDYSLAMSFKDGVTCTTDDDNTINICADSVYVNDFDISLIANKRRDLEEDRETLDHVSEMNLKKMSENEQLVNENEKMLSQLRLELEGQMKTLLALSAAQSQSI